MTSSAGGFCRYSVDELLDDPALREDALRQREPARLLRTDGAGDRGPRLCTHRGAKPPPGCCGAMQSPEGGFYSSFDADSEGHEGTFYVWTREEVRGTLRRAGVRGVRAALRSRPSRELRGQVAPATSRNRWRKSPPQPGCRPQRPTALIGAARAKLLTVRARRVPPARDDKVLTSWNALDDPRPRNRSAHPRPARPGRIRHARARADPRAAVA